MSTPFLQQVASSYLGNQDLEDFCFVFPNRRSGQFFTHYLQQELMARDQARGVKMPHLMPAVTSINDLVARLTGTDAASDIEMMFALYDAYCRAMGDRAQEFDKFIYWAQLIINDFNDIDKSLADADDIYRNLDDLHGLSSNYLSPEVLEKVKKIFGENLFTAFFDTRDDADLWQRRAAIGGREAGSEHDDVVKREFVSLWNALPSIYHYYHEALRAKEVVSPGMQLRMAATGDLNVSHGYRRFAFVGFGVLSAAEVKLFERFKMEAMADFWWDNAGLKFMLAKAPHDPGALLIDGYCKRFGAKELEPIQSMTPSIRLVAVPSNVGQAKQAFAEVDRMPVDKQARGIDTAIVLPDEALLVPLLHAVPDDRNLNVTLGYPLRSSGIISLMHIVARMHHQASKERDNWTYYREDVNDILSHPLIKTCFTREAMAMSASLAVTNRFRVPASEFADLSFHDLFTPAMDSAQPGTGREQQAGYIDNLLAFCNLLMDRMPQDESQDDDEDNKQGVELPLQQAFLVMYIDVLNQLKRALNECGQALQRSTVFFLIDRLASSAIVPFTGEPLQGMQVMGLLETRSLDFKNVVILSMNERILPRRRGINSFIPNYIRRAHGMSTTEQQEAIIAFNFYRLLNRSSHVTLIYDSSIKAFGSNEPSRYISQMEKIYGMKLEHIDMSTKVNTSPPIAIQVPGFEDNSLHDLFTRDPETSGGRYLSASAINKYINCPLNYYLQYVQGLSSDNEMGDFMDSGTFGTIVHDTLRDCYVSDQLRARGNVVDKDYIDYFVKNRLENAVVRNIKRVYLRMPADKLDSDTQPLRGEAFMLVDTIKSYVKFVLDYDLDLIAGSGPITILECEKTHNLPAMKVGSQQFNFTYKPDRVDRLADGTIRIIDYKTGADSTEFAVADGLPALFDREQGFKRCKAILQLFLYCYAYLLENPDVPRVMPVIYKLASMDDSGVWVRKPRGQYVFSLDDGNTVAHEFIRQMSLVVDSLYHDDFVQASEDKGPCGYCRFIDFCRRIPKVKKF